MSADFFPRGDWLPEYVGSFFPRGDWLPEYVGSFSPDYPRLWQKFSGTSLRAERSNPQ
jgi:hypothetical protein